MPFVPTHENVADFFTKALPLSQFVRMRERVMNLPAYTCPPSAGGSLGSSPPTSGGSPLSECGGVLDDSVQQADQQRLARKGETAHDLALS